MKIEIEIPKEFEEHFNEDRFEDSLHRLSADAHLIAGNYEQEVAIMLIQAFREGKISEKDLKTTEGYIKYMTILDILNKCACSMGKPKTSMRKIKNIMEELEYDEEYIANVTVDFCNGFETARNIIAKLISDNYWKRDE